MNTKLVDLWRTINRRCVLCGSKPVAHFVGTKEHFYSCEKHKEIVSDLCNQTEEDRGGGDS